MTVLARIQDSAVAELLDLPPALQSFTVADLFHPALTWVDVTAVAPQPQAGWATTEAAGVWTFTPPPAPPLPSPAQLAAAALAGGLTVTSASTPAISAIYPADPVTIGHIQSEMLAVLVAGTFADGTGTLAWPDIGGEPHTFPTTDAFKAFALAMAAFVAGCLKAGSGAVPLPASSVSIP